MEIVIILLSSCLLISLIFMFKLFSINLSLRISISDLEKSIQKTKKEKEEIFSIDIGDRALIPDYQLKVISTNESFQVTYEVEIIEVSKDQVKVRSKDYTTNDKYAKDPKNKKSIVDFMQDKWIPKKEIELIVDDQMRRDRKLQEILN